MKNIKFLIPLLFSFAIQAQDFSVQEIAEGNFERNDAAHPCISAEQYAILNQECSANLRKLGLESNLRRNILTTSLIWPIRAAIDFNDCGYHFIGAYVDQNTAAGMFSDFNCEANTYDGHQGTDIAIWPFSFYKMDNSQVEVIAAAPGIIVQKADGNFDRNCSMNTMTANSIIVQHADGSCALYWHMKKNSLTTKNVGDSVTAGEFLGVVGSSGSASGPHLHFEIWSGITSSIYKDPFSGTCNLLNANSWWADQKPHTDPKAIKVSVNTTDIVLPGCPNTETPNEADLFTIPFQGPGLAPGYAKFYVFTRDDSTGLTGDCKILNPNGSVFNSWTFASTSNNKAYIRGYSKVLPTTAGNYIFQVTYNGVTCSKNFEMINPLSVDETSDINWVKVSPNPFSDELTVSGSALLSANIIFTLTNIAGQMISVEKMDSGQSKERKFKLSNLAAGVYFLTIGNGSTRKVLKVIKQ